MKETSKKYIAEMSCNEMKRTEGGYTLPEVVVVGSNKNFENNVGEVYRDLGTDAAIGLVLNYWYYNFFGFLITNSPLQNGGGGIESIS